jgi:hypothetical protein
MFESRVLRGIFVHSGEEGRGEWRNYIMISLMICTAYQISFG